MRVALYARVSTKQHGQNPETQLIPLRDLARTRGYTIVEEYIDLGWSGAKERRPRLDTLMHDARKKRFDVVLVWRFDRFARSTRHLLTAMEEFEKLGVQFISSSEAIDTTTPVGKLVFTILSAVAQMERSLIRERVLAGIYRARKEGKRIGRPTVLVDRVRILERLASGESKASVARAYGVSRGKIRQVERDGKKGSGVGGNNPVAD